MMILKLFLVNNVGRNLGYVSAVVLNQVLVDSQFGSYVVNGT